MTMKSTGKARALLAPLAALLLLAACGRDDDGRQSEAAQPATSPTDSAGGGGTMSGSGTGGGPATGSGTMSQGGNTTDGQARAAGEMMDDATITARVKAGLLADDQVKGLQINVDTQNGEVTLTGRVQNQSQISRALEIAGRTEGVRKVNNRLTVGTGS